MNDERSTEWAEPLLKWRIEQFTGSGLSEDTITFLTQTGLPQSAAPCLDFETPENAHVGIFPERWGVPEVTKEHLRRYVHIGSDGGGNPICLDPALEDRVVMLDHEGGFAPAFINTSIQHFAASLLRVKQLYEQADENEQQGGVRVTPRMQEELRRDLERIDAAALGPNLFWSCECECIVDYL